MVRYPICLFLMIVGVCAATSASDRPPNIIYIMADDLGHGSIGAYGGDKIRTPHIDRLAAEGIRLTQAYSGSAVCAPARSVLMTGLHTGHTPVRGNGMGWLLDEDVTIAQVLKERGYTSGLFGKWGLGDTADSPGHPLRQGFDTFFGQLHQVHAHFYYPYWVWKDFERYALPGNIGGKREQYVHDEIHTQAMNFIRASKDRPFFAYLAYIIPHVELVVPEEDEAPYRDNFPRVSITDPRPNYIGSDHGYATYAGMVTRMDRHIGEVMALLKELGIDEHTLVIFTSDNGAQGGGAWEPLVEFFNGGGGLRGSKGSLYEGGIRVPMIARWPGKIAPGTTTDHVCYFADILPTFAEAAGADTPSDIDGISFLPTLIGHRDQPQHAYLYWWHQNDAAVRFGDWKALKPRGRRPMELYNLAQDPHEKHNVAAKHPQLVHRAERYMQEAYSPPREYGPRVNVGYNDFVK